MFVPPFCTFCLTQDGFLFSVSIISGVTCVILAVIKYMLGKVLTSRALITDGRCAHSSQSGMHENAKEI